MLSKLKKWWNRPKWVRPTLKKLNRLIDEGKADYPRLGLCANCLSGAPLMYSIAAFKSWSEYSGRPYHPVPHPTKEPWVAYQTIKFKFIDEYGRSRIRLAIHIREVLLRDFY